MRNRRVQLQLFCKCHRLVLASLFAIVFAAQVFAQGETTSAISGVVSDPTGASVPGITVTLTNRETCLQRAAKTDDEGRYIFPQLQPGNYAVTVQGEGFEPQQLDDVSAGLGQRQTVNFTLKLAQSKLTLEVTRAAPLINPQK